MDRQRENITVMRSAGSEKLLYHFHNGYEMIFIQQGSAVFTVDGRACTYGPGSVIFINQMEQHEMQPVGLPYIRYFIIIEPDFFDRFISVPALCSLFKNRPEHFQNGFALAEEDAAFLRGIMERCAAEYIEQASYWEETVMAFLTQALIRLYRQYPQRFPMAEASAGGTLAIRVQEEIDAGFLEELTLESLAETLGVNKFHMAHVFKEVTGYTVKQYVQLKRISHAKNLLYYTDRNVEHIAVESGFHSTSNFIRAFRGIEKITPLQYRKLCR